MPVESDTITGPSFLAPALINGDLSGLSKRDLECLDRFTDSIAPWYVVGTVEGSLPWFTWAFTLYGGHSAGGCVIDYVVHKVESHESQQAA